MKLLAIESLVGGAGATTLTANLAAALRQGEQRVAVIDCCAQNHLAAHFGQPLTETMGVFTHTEAPESTLESAFIAASGVLVAPYGSATESAQSITAQHQQRFEQLLQELQELSKPRVDWVLLNLPTGFSFAPNVMLPNAASCLLVLEPEPRCYMNLQRWQARQGRPEQLRYRAIMNKVAPHLELPRDIFDLCQAELDPEWLLPLYINRDQHIPEALATQQLLFEYTLGAQGNADFAELAAWLQASAEIEQ